MIPGAQTMALARGVIGVALGIAAAIAPATLAVAGELPRFSYDVPLDPHSPWPKFRRDARQTGRSPVLPRDSGAAVWEFQTGKGVFSSPVVDGEGTVYVGSADRVFYAIDRHGQLRWSQRTGEIIDSAALLDDAGRVIVGSGDGRLYAFDRRSGDVLWTFAADPPSATGAFINWFEGNVAIGADGTLYVPNDNFCTYAIERQSGERRWCFRTRDQTWSLPAVDPRRGTIFLGNNFPFASNIFALAAGTGEAIWKARARGSVVASPLLAGVGDDRMLVAGAFDGYVRAYSVDSRERWTLGLRDHVYASAAEAADGTLVQPGTDGTVYGIEPTTGAIRWAFDTAEPIRSSPAIDGAGNIYVGTGDGRLLVLGAGGQMRWAIRLIEGDRNDLNASPALGTDAIVIAGENGAVFGVPYEYCLRPVAERDSRCTVAGGEGLAEEGAFLLYATAFGSVLGSPPAAVEANQPLAFSLLVRRGGDTELAVIDDRRLRVTLTPEVPARVDVSGDRRFLTVIPAAPYTPSGGGDLRVRIQGEYLVDLERRGLRLTGGRIGGAFDQSFHFAVRPRTPGAFPLPVPRQPGDPSGVWELYRLAAPLPTILPSYNQIGFDSIHYLIGMVEGDGQRAVGWVVGGQPSAEGQGGEVDPLSTVRFPLLIDHDAGLLTMRNEAGFTVEFNNFPMPFELFHVAATVDSDGDALVRPSLAARARCSEIDFYGAFLERLGYCNPRTQALTVFGGAELRRAGGGVQALPRGVGQARFEAEATGMVAAFTGSEIRVREHNLGLLVIDADTNQPLPLDYGGATTVRTSAAGTLEAIALGFAPGDVRGDVRVYAMIDAYPAARATLHLPETPPWSATLAYRLRRLPGALRSFVVARLRDAFLWFSDL